MNKELLNLKIEALRAKLNTLKSSRLSEDHREELASALDELFAKVEVAIQMG